MAERTDATEPLDQPREGGADQGVARDGETGSDEPVSGHDDGVPPVATSEASSSSASEVEIQPFDNLVAQLNTGQIDVEHFVEAIELQDAADAADTLEDLRNMEEATEVLVEMDTKAAADALAEMDLPLACA